MARMYGSCSCMGAGRQIAGGEIQCIPTPPPPAQCAVLEIQCIPTPPPAQCAVLEIQCIPTPPAHCAVLEIQYVPSSCTMCCAHWPTIL